MSGAFDDAVVSWRTRHASWRAVAGAIRSKRDPSNRPQTRTLSTTIPDRVGLRVASSTKPLPYDLGPYQTFIGPRRPALIVYVVSPRFGPTTTVKPADDDDIDRVIAAILAAEPAIADSRNRGPEVRQVVLAPPSGVTW